jgi:hypothetical protein
MTNTSEDPAVTISKTNAKSAQAQAVLESAKNRLATTQEHLEKTQDLYLKSSAQLVEQQTKLAEIQGEITKLGETKLGLVSLPPLPLTSHSSLGMVSNADGPGNCVGGDQEDPYPMHRAHGSAQATNHEPMPLLCWRQRRD